MTALTLITANKTAGKLRKNASEEKKQLKKEKLLCSYIILFYFIYKIWKEKKARLEIEHLNI